MTLDDLALIIPHRIADQVPVYSADNEYLGTFSNVLANQLGDIVVWYIDVRNGVLIIKVKGLYSSIEDDYGTVLYGG